MRRRPTQRACTGAPRPNVAGALFWVVVLAGLVAAATHARAEPADGAAYKGWRVAGVEIDGVDKKTRSALRSGLALCQTKGLLKSGRPVFYPQTLGEDVNRCRLFLARNGYPYATVEPLLRPAPDARSVAVTFSIVPGPPVRVASLAVDGIPAGVGEEAGDVRTLQPAEVFSDARLDESGAALRSFLREQGYARAEVVSRVEWIDSTRVDVSIVATPGPRMRFGEKIVEGAGPDLVPLVKKTMETRRGRYYSPDAVRRSQNNLRMLDLFRQVRVQTRPARGDTLDTVADLIPREPRLVETGLGYWTDDLLRVRARWLHRNLFRRGRGLSVGASASRFLQTGNVSLWWPAAFGSRTRTGISAKVERHDEESYDLLRVGLDSYLTYQYSLLTAVRAGVEVSSVDLDVAADAADVLDVQGGLLTVLSLRWSRTASDDRLYPTRGTVSWVLLQWAPGGSLSDNHFVSIEASGTAYHPLGGTVLAVRAEAGVAEPTNSSDELLPNVRFYSGGASSMRGFKRRRLGPYDAAGDPIGGEAKLEAASELRFPLFWRLRGALFVDTGQVWERSNDVSLGDIAVAVGPGLRLSTPVGPIRTDFGYRATNGTSGEPRWVFHLSIGPAF